MAYKPQRTIRFLNHWRGRMPGELNSVLPHGVMVELVRSRKAEFVEGEEAKRDERERPRRRLRKDAEQILD